MARELSKTLGYPVFDADEVYKRLLATGGEMTRQIIRAFPECEEDGKVNRRILGQIVFSNSEKKKLLESISHPCVAKEADMLIAENRGCILDVPLLFESGLDRLCTATVGVVAAEDIIADRIMSRDNISQSDAALRLASQPNIEYYRARCDIIVKNGKNGIENISELAQKLTKI